MLPNFASRLRNGTRASPRAAATRSLGPDDSLAHCVLSLRVAGPRGAPRDAKEAGAKVYPLVSFPVRTRRPARVLRGLLAARAEASETPPHATPAEATLGSAAKSGCLDAARATDSRSVTTTTRRLRRVAHSRPDDWLPGRLAACIAHSCTGGLDSATPWRTPGPCSNRKKR